MPNTLGNYNPIFYAQEALIQLESELGMAARVHRGYETERRSYGRGEFINVRGPGSFSVGDAPSSAQDIVTRSEQIQLNNWKEVRFTVTDKEKAYTGEQLIDQHIRPAAVALATYIDEDLTDLYKYCPWSFDMPATAGVQYITTPRRIMKDNKAPTGDRANMHMLLDPTAEENLLTIPAFHSADVTGPGGNTSALTSGELTRKFGVELFASQSVKKHTKGTASAATLAVNNASGYAVGDTTVNLDASSVTGTLVPGDVITFANHSQKYSVTNTVTAGSNAFAGVGIFPALQMAVANDAAVAVDLDDHTANLMFHRNFAAFVMAPLPDPGSTVESAVITDPNSGLSLRVIMYHDGAQSSSVVVMDCLYGMKALDANLACRLRG